jgi:hypothetical protein
VFPADANEAFMQQAYDSLLYLKIFLMLDRTGASIIPAVSQMSYLYQAA